jgi:excisionase family DNA binding protein
MVQYYTLEEAAQLLQVTADKLKEMVKRNEIRAFQDRGTLRFRKQEIDELVRAWGLGSNPDFVATDKPKGGSTLQPTDKPKGGSTLQPGDKPKGGSSLHLGEKSKPPGTPPSSSSRRKSKVEDAGTFNLVDDQPPPEETPSGRHKSGMKSPSPKSPSPKSPRPSSLRSPYPKAASDSDVRLVSDGSDLDFHLDLDDAPKSKSPEGGPKSKAPEGPKSKPPEGASAKPSSRKKSQVPPPMLTDSQVPGMPPPNLEHDSDVKIEGESSEVVPLAQEGAKRPSDSDIRLEGDPLAPGTGSKKRESSLITEEIDLDAEAANIEAARRKAQQAKQAPSSAELPALPTSSPFELSENDLDMGMEHEPEPRSKGESALGDDEKEDTSNFDLAKAAEPSQLEEEEEKEGSSDFDLTATPEPSPLEPSSQEHEPLPGSSDDEVTLGELTGAGVGASGINIQEPADSGISLEGSEDEIEFDLSLDADAGATPAPKTPKSGEEESSEFELSLPDEEGAAGVNTGADSDSEFELTLDEEGAGTSELESGSDEESDSGSDSEFELTLDEEGGLGVDEASESSEEEGKDIFETDFDVPALDEEAGTEAGAEGASGASTDLEDSEFELDLEPEEGSGTEDIAAEEEAPTFEEEPQEFEEEEQPAPKRKTSMKARKAAALEEEDEEGLDLSLDTEAEEEEAEEEEEPTVAAGAAAAPPAEWGALPALMLLPALVVLIVVGLMGFELVQGMWGFHKSHKVTSLVIDPVTRIFVDDKELPKE